VLPKQAKIGVAAAHLLLEEQADLFRLYSDKTSFPSAEPHDGELIVLAGLHLQGTACGSIGYDRGHQLRHGEGLTDTRRLHHPEILHDLLKQSFQVGHDVSLLSLVARLERLPIALLFSESEGLSGRHPPLQQLEGRIGVIVHEEFALAFDGQPLEKLRRQGSP